MPSFTKIEVIPSSSPTPKHVVIIKSSSNPMFELPIESFTAQIEQKITIVTLQPNPDREKAAREILSMKPDVVFSLGNKATHLAKEKLSEIPIVFTMVPNYKSLDLDNKNNIYGVSLEAMPGSDFIHFKMVLPNLTDVLVFYESEQSKKIVFKAQQDLKNLGINLIPVHIANFEELKQAYAKFRQTSGGVWLHIDPIVMNRQSYHFLKNATQKDKIPLVASLSEQFTKDGAVASVSLDFAAIGSQSATIAQMLLQKNPIPKEQRIQSPVGGQLTVNLETAKQLGIQIQTDVFPYIYKVYTHRMAENNGN